MDDAQQFLFRPALHRWLALRSSHGDFDWYHRKFNHEDAKLDCSCGRRKSPEHLALCHKTQKSFRHWPKPPPTPPTDGIEAVAYLRSLDPKQFVELLELTSFYSRVCTSIARPNTPWEAAGASESLLPAGPETTEERNNGTHSLRYPLRHFSQTVPGQSERVFYGGTTSEEISDRQNDRQNDRIGLQHWAREGIAGRGVLIDYATWAEKKGMEYTTFSTHQVRFADILENAEENNITFQRGDILFVYPPQSPDIFLHEYVLAGWGMPIGELFDLEALARTCQELQRWSFFVASVPLNMPGGVSPPPNVMAIF
ncbi:hypothetical protein PDIDSM_6993 [Penicillium digitatum]|nr:hypothetical protein PDIDSM_6993 [Penicillium digitatum]